MTPPRLAPFREIATLDVAVFDVESTAEYPIAGVYGFGRGLIDRGVIRGSETSYARLQRLRSGQIVFSRLKAFEGAIAVVPPDFDGHFVSQEFPTFTIDESRASIDYVAHLCRWPDLWVALGSGSKGVGARRERLHADDFLSIEIALPPIDEQLRVVNRISRVLGVKASIEARKAHVGEVDFGVFFSRALDQLISEFPRETVALGELVAPVADQYRPGDDPANAEAFVGLEHIESHTGRRLGSRPIGGEKGSKRRFQAGDIVYGTLRPYLNKVWVAEFAGLCSVDQRVFRPHRNVDADVLAYGLRAWSFLTEVKRQIPAQMLPRIGSAALLRIPLIVPKGQARAVFLQRVDLEITRVLRLRDLIRRRDLELTAIEPAVLNSAFSASG